MRALLQVLLLLTVSLAYADEFVPSIAVSNARSVADRDKKQLFVDFVHPDTTPDRVTRFLTQAAKDKACIAILGPDYALNATILKGAFQGAAKGSLKGATVIVVNDGEDIEDLRNAAALTGATVRATRYSRPTVSWRDDQFCARTATNELELGRCLDEQADDAEQELNETYQKVMARLSADEKNELRREEHSWTKWRDAECAKQAKDVEECVNGCGVPRTMHVVCMTREANNRVDELKGKVE